jgi:hypothetical protein
MTRIDGALARKLDFNEGAANGSLAAGSYRPKLRPAKMKQLSGPGKYRVLEVRRRRAQIAARHLLDLMDAQERSR